MIRNDPGVIEDEEFIADRRPAAHHHRKYQGKHQDVRDGFEQCPAVSEPGVAEAGAGLPDDQGMDDAALGAQCFKKSGRRPQFPGRSQLALAEHDIIAVQGLEPAVQYLQHRLRVFFVFRRDADQFAADGERLGKAAAVEIDCQLRALGVGI